MDHDRQPNPMSNDVEARVDNLFLRVNNLEAQNMAYWYLLTQLVFVASASQEDPRAFHEMMYNDIHRNIDAGASIMEKHPYILEMVRSTCDRLFSLSGNLIGKLNTHRE